VVVAEDHALVRQGIGLLLQAAGGFELVGETSLGSEAIELVRRHQPDLLLLDLALSDWSGIEVARKVRKACPGVRILVVTGNVYPGSIEQSVRAGADGFLLKHDQGTELLDAIRTVMTGRSFVSPHAARLPEDTDQRRAPHATGLSPILTQREQQIVRMIAGGHSNQDIASELHISVLTARKHRQNIMLKLGLHNGAEIAAYAMQAGLAGAPAVPPVRTPDGASRPSGPKA
jgi:DNA-binding NarL/FixJ family response regulator